MFILFISFLSAKEEFFIMVDKDFSPYAGGENILTLHETVEYISSKYLKIPKESKLFYNFIRLAEEAFIWYPLSEFEMVLQHEVFGHGYRIRDINSNSVWVYKYKIKVPFPYGKGGGETSYFYSENLTDFGKLSLDLGGVESTAVLANRLKMKWSTSLFTNPKKAFLYILTQQDLTNYVYSMDDSIFFTDNGDDIESYIHWLNIIYYNDDLKKEDLKKAVLLNFFDPTTFYSLASIFVYIFTGKDMPFYMIGTNDFKFLPNLRLGLAPYGLDYYLENFMSYKQSPMYAYLRFGKYNSNFYYGGGLEYPAVYKSDCTKIGFKFDFYRQPKIYFKKGLSTHDGIQTGYSPKELNKMTLGCLTALIFEKRLSRKSSTSFYAECGYKTKGYIMGQSLKNGFIFRIALGLNSF